MIAAQCSADPAELRVERARSLEHRLAQPCRQRRVRPERAGRSPRGPRAGVRSVRPRGLGAVADRPPSCCSVASRTFSYGVRSRSGWSSTSSRTPFAAGSSFSAARTSTSASSSGPMRSPPSPRNCAAPRPLDLGQRLGAQRGIDGGDGRAQVRATRVALGLDQPVEHRVQRGQRRDLAGADGRAAARRRGTRSGARRSGARREHRPRPASRRAR